MQQPRWTRWIVSALLCASSAGCAGLVASAPVVPVTEWPTVDPLVDLATDRRLILRPAYASDQNFVGEVLYPVPRVLMRQSAFDALCRVQDRLDALDLRLVVWDAYRPHHVQRRMWELVPDPDFVADPARGSRHNRGMAVDVTLARLDGTVLTMPTAYDAFTPRARANTPIQEDDVRANRDLLIATMASEGFTVLRTEWWHFDAAGWQDAAVLDVALDEFGR
tara:strand:+ start:20892 stop:21557 length:666 start_codon:yes stop_codon:yes gene_type:complete